MTTGIDTCVLISAGAEWRAFMPHFPDVQAERTPYGACFTTIIDGRQVACLHGGWGKVAAACSTQYAIDRWKPARVINLGTCGGLQGQVMRNQVILASRTIIYDIVEEMSDYDAAIQHYTVDFNLAWLPDPPPQPVVAGTIVSADRDLQPGDIPDLIQRYSATVADWESGAIAWVAQRNAVPCLILRAVSDLVSETGGEAYDNVGFFEQQCQQIMANFAHYLPAWLAVFSKSA